MSTAPNENQYKHRGISYRETGFFSELVCDYLDKNEKLNPFYHRYPTLEAFEAQIEEKQRAFPKATRDRLSKTLQIQYQNISIAEYPLHHIEKLKEHTTFTVTTGHQLNIFTGPLYTLYKIITTINLAGQLQEAYPEYHFVPIYWMATEDHDFEEINHFTHKKKKIQWNKKTSGAVGKLKTEGLDAILKRFEEELGSGKNADNLKTLFREAYLQHDHLSSANRCLIHALFGAYGLVIIDADAKELKRCFIPYIEDELVNETSFKAVTQTIEQLEALSPEYNIQVTPRSCNLFYLRSDIRERIIRKNDTYYIKDTDTVFTKEEILNEVKTYPERFSPNVIMRPLYQEVILPNVCYIGGGGELAYWLELKRYFTTLAVPFPILMLRNSALLLTKKQLEKLEKLQVLPEELFLGNTPLIHRKVKEISAIPIDFTPQKEHLKRQFKALYTLAKRTDNSFYGAVKAQEVKQIKGLEKLEKRLLKAQKKKEQAHVDRISALYTTLFPDKSLQERSLNFSEYYQMYGDAFISTLMRKMNPFSYYFFIITL